MLKDVKVSWKLKNGTPGWGMTASDEVDGKIQVAVHSSNNVLQEMHYVILCTTTWLTPVGVVSQPAAAPAPKATPAKK
jgi:hypothetical protein